MQSKLVLFAAAACTMMFPVFSEGADGVLSKVEDARALEIGRSFAPYSIEEDLRRFGDKKFKQSPGTLIAEGDSWFDYPRADVLKMLRRQHGYIVESVAHHGDTLDKMTYDRDQLVELAGAFKSIHDRDVVPKAILLSAGGNDIAGPELAVMLNNSRSGLNKRSMAISQELIAIRFRTAMITLLGAITDMAVRTFGRPIPILVHGYDYPVPDGRGFLGGWWFLPGPWLKPSFDLKSDSATLDSVEADKKVIRGIIDEYNAMLQSLPGVQGLGHVKYVKVVGTLSSDLSNYEQDWGNELHPTEDGFAKVAAKFQKVLQTLP